MTTFIEPLRGSAPEILARGTPDGPLTGVTPRRQGHRRRCRHHTPARATRTGWPPTSRRHGTLRRCSCCSTPARLVIGKAHTDEFAWSLSGTNHHYGTPRNPAAPRSGPRRVVVGLGVSGRARGRRDSRSGPTPRARSAFRPRTAASMASAPSHGRVPVKGIHPLAWSFDTCGLLAADGEVLQRGARVLLESEQHKATAGPAEPLRSLCSATDLVDQADPVVAAAVRDGAARHGERAGHPARRRRASASTGSPNGCGRSGARQMVEAWQANGRWMIDNRPRLGPGVAARFAAARATHADRGGPGDDGRHPVRARA